MRTRVTVLALLGASLVVSACGSSKSPSAGTTPSPAKSASTAVATTTTVTRTVAASSAPAPLCTARQMALSFLGQQGAAGHGEVGFALRNTGTVACHTAGFPGIQWLDRSGHALPTVPKHVTTDMAGSVPVVKLTLAPGQTASFRLFVTHGAVPGLPCTTAYGLQAIPPNDTGTLRTSIPDGAFQCRDTMVSPLRPGNSAYQG
jgi:hypothetical protein